jgi:hypothetical protein
MMVGGVIVMENALGTAATYYTPNISDKVADD